MKILLYLAGAAMAIMVVSCSSRPEYSLVWQDEFNYEGLPDSSKWSYDVSGNATGWGNNEAQFYTIARPENVNVSDGKLIITAIKEPISGKNYSSARLRTKGKGDWKYGKFEIRAKLPAGRGIWPAIWMFPSTNDYGNWPSGGEIDIMEHVGYMPDSVFCTIHTEAFNHLKNTQVSKSSYVPDCDNKFHIYTMEWDSTAISFFVDQNEVLTFTHHGGTYKEWPFDKPFHLIMNIAVGGYWGGKEGIDTTIFPQEMIVDYVRVYKRM
ncbi:MAG TPA: glycoside hydrolase family 16 protein [Bacteroidales bacterium]|nr:glycoside hydrolase family 16 protein [Bacteroidales bacterium]